MELQAINIGKVYPSLKGNDVIALAGVNLELSGREFISIVGPSGCGKTTFLKIVAGLQKPSTGEIRFRQPLAPGRIRCALVFQDHGLLPWSSVLDNVALGLQFVGIARKERESRALAFIEHVGLAPFANRLPHELSIGMRQRVGIARAFVADSEFLLLDEPFGSLDAQTKLILQEELLRIWREHQRPVIHVTHDIEEAILLSDRILVMSGRPGQIREEIRLSLPRPRDPRSIEAPEISEIRWHIWKILEEEVKKSLWVID